ncbi:hypothetical protein [Demetria terragena]|uniref:hypothetical protein n=1 Tax=Demetria terragena TaxID=63959 RepID=UPI0003652E71|nr:hypothetical protein [Demetria terragena]
MRTWLAPLVMVLVLLWVWWMRRQLRTAYLGRLVAAARGREGRARRITTLWQLSVAGVGAVLIVLAGLAEWVWEMPVLRIVLALFVIAVVVPLGSIVAGRDDSQGRQRKVRVRRSAQERLAEVGASREVALAVVHASRPFAYVSFVMGMVASVVLVWHD